MPNPDQGTQQPLAPAASHTNASAIPAASEVQDQSDADKLKAYRIVEEARSQFLSWLKWTFGVGVIFVGLVGVKGYSDWTATLAAQRTELDAKIRQQVDENLRTNFKARTDEVLDSAVKARAEIALSTRTVGELQNRSKELEIELNRFREKLSALERQAEGKATEFTSRLDRIAADFEGPAGRSNQRAREQAFLRRSREYASKVGLTLSEPRVVFREDSAAPGQILAMYDSKQNAYIVSPSKLDTPGLPEYSALMGRFFEKNRDVLNNVGKPGFPDIQLWQNFRQSVVNYLLVSDGVQLKPDAPDGQLQLYRTLKALEPKSSIPSTRKLAVALLEAFDRSWNSSNVSEKVLAVNEQVGALPSSVLKDVLARS